MHCYRTVKPSYRNARIADLAAEAASKLAELPFVPKVNFVKLDPYGDVKTAEHVRDEICAGFVDVFGQGDSKSYEVFVAADLSASETARIVFHEVRHVQQYATGKWKTTTPAQRESDAREFQRLAPTREPWGLVFGEMAFKLAKLALNNGDLQSARRYCVELSTVNPDAAWKINALIKESEAAR